MFNFSANNLSLLAKTEAAKCWVFIMLDGDTKRVYRLLDFSKARIITPNHIYCVSGKVNSADTLYLVIESVRVDTKHCCPSSPTPVDGAGG
jgi:hypothetical protein